MPAMRQKRHSTSPPSRQRRQMKFAYADPPYYGRAKEIYGKLHNDAGKWDLKETHHELIKLLTTNYPDGWALSCNSKDLPWLLPACPNDIRIASWCKSWHQIRPTSTQWAWEPLIWRTVKKEPKRQMVRDYLVTGMQTKTNTPGAKPNVFNRWVLDLLIFDPTEDTLDDLYPGSGSMAKTMTEQKLF